MKSTILLSESHAFVQVVEAGSFTAAARKLGVPKSTLSRQVTRLEEEFGARLLQRTTRKLNLTETGRAYYERCRDALTTLYEADREARDASDEPRGNLRVTLPFDFARDFMAPALREFRERYPQISVSLIVTQRSLDLIDEQIDVALRGGQMPDSDFVSRKLNTSGIVLCASPEYIRRRGMPETWEELEQHDTLGLSPNGRPGFIPFQGPDGPKHLPKNPWLVASEWGVLLRAALDGTGIAPMLDLGAGPHIDSGALVRVLPEYAIVGGALYAIYPSRHHLSRKVRVFVDFIAEHISPQLSAAQENLQL